MRNGLVVRLKKMQTGKCDSCFRKKLYRAYKYYIKGDYHCDTCKYCYGGEYLMGCDDYCDAYCYVKGDISEGACRLIPPIKFIIGSINEKKITYHRKHEYDDIEEWYVKQEEDKNKVIEELEKYFKEEDVDFAIHCGELYYKLSEILNKKEWHPIKVRWKTLIKDTWKAFIERFIPYFCKYRMENYIV